MTTSIIYNSTHGVSAKQCSQISSNYDKYTELLEMGTLDMSHVCLYGVNFPLS